MNRLFAPFCVLTLASLFSGCSLMPNEKAYQGFGVQPLVVKEGDTVRGFMSKNFDTCALKQGKDGCLDYAIAVTVEESNRICMLHLKDIYGNDAAFNISTGTFATLTSGAAAITDGGRAKLLAALSAFSNAERSLVNETIYKNQITAHIGSKISQSRETALATIKAGLKSNEYSLALATFDVQTYHNNCSFFYGLQKVLEEGTNTTPATKLSQLEVERELLLLKLAARERDIGVSRTENDAIYLSHKTRLAALDAQINALRSGQGPVTKLKDASNQDKNPTQNDANKPADKNDAAGESAAPVANGKEADKKAEDDGSEKVVK